MTRFLLPILGLVLLGVSGLRAQDDLPARVTINGDEPRRTHVVVGARRLIDRTIAERRAAPKPEPGDAVEVIMAAFRTADIPLQELMEKDRRLAPRAYQGRRPPRSTESLVVFLERRRLRCRADAVYEEGDILVWKLPDGRLHPAILSKVGSRWSGPDIVHRPGDRVVEEPLPPVQLVGHYRWWLAKR